MGRGGVYLRKEGSLSLLKSLKKKEVKNRNPSRGENPPTRGPISMRRWPFQSSKNLKKG